MNQEDKNAPKVEPVGEHQPEPTDSLEAIRSDVEALKTSIKEEVVDAFRSELKKLQEPKREKVPAPDVERSQDSRVRVTGHGTDPLYRSLPSYEQPYRNRGIDALAQKWLVAVHNKDWESQRRVGLELDDLVRADEITEGTPDSNAGIGSGTGAPLIPVPLAGVISEVRNRRAKIRRRAQIFTSPNQTLRVPTGDVVTAEMVGEGSTASNLAAGLGTILLSKKKMQARFSITNEMLADSPFNLVSYFTRRAGAAMGQLEDEEFATVRGQAASISTALEGIGGEVIVAPQIAGRVSYADLVKLVFSIGEEWTDNATLFANANGMRLLSALQDGDGRPILTPLVAVPQTVGDQVSGNQMQVFSKPVIQLPLTTSGTDSNLVDVWFGDLNEYAILQDGGFTVASSEHVEFDNDRVVWKVTQRIDGAPLQPQAFARLMAVSGTNNGATSNTFI